jgi:tetratricopeptide (TPR) repeat protein
MKLLVLLAFPVLAVSFDAAAQGRPNSPTDTSHRVVISGNAQAQLCSSHAKLVADGKMSPAFAVETCTEALEIETLSVRDMAATHNNRGVVLLGMAGEVPTAQQDFVQASKILPQLGESYVNLGAALVSQRRYADAITEIEKGMALGVEEPWKAHFNRAVARENLGNVAGAYEDFKMAAELRPNWEPPTTELARFQVTRR